MENVNALLYAFRCEHHKDGAPMSKQELAQKLGVSRQTLRKWLNGETKPSFDMLCSIADLLGVSLDTLAGR